MKHGTPRKKGRRMINIPSNKGKNRARRLASIAGMAMARQILNPTKEIPNDDI